MPSGFPGWKQWVFVGALVAGGVALANLDTMAFAMATASNEARPRLLEDAHWGEADPDGAFARHFAVGTAEADLLAWLGDNRFAVDRAGRRAERRVRAVPCNERIVVTWGASDAGRLTVASAEVREAGCL